MNNDFTIGDPIKIKHKFEGEKKSKIITGTIIEKNDFHITLKTKNYKTSFMLTDFLIGSAVVLRGR